MSSFNTRAIVLKTQDLNENDKLVWLFSEKIGKITAVARGAKRNKSKFMSSTLPFCFGDYVLYKGKSLFTINESEIIDSFQDLLRDIETITYASYLCELIDICVVENESNRDLFRGLISAFYLIKNDAVDIEILARAFEVKILQFTGYSLSLGTCCICRHPISTSNYISFQYSGGICSSCEKSNGMYISFACYNTLKYFTKMPLENVYRVNITRQIKDELYKVLSIIISQNYYRKPKSLHILNYLKEELK